MHISIYVDAYMYMYIYMCIYINIYIYILKIYIEMQYFFLHHKFEVVVTLRGRLVSFLNVNNVILIANVK